VTNTVNDSEASRGGEHLQLTSEKLYEGAECDVDMGNAAEAPVAAAAAGVPATFPQEELEKMTRIERKHWKKQGGRLR